MRSLEISKDRVSGPGQPQGSQSPGRIGQAQKERAR